MQLSDHVYLVGSGSNGFGLSHASDCHTYLVNGGPELALVDSGAGLGTQDILANVRAHGFELDRIRFLLLTHIHADHAGGAAATRDATPEIQVLASTEAAKYLREGDQEATSVNLGKRAGYYPQEYVFRPCAVDGELGDGDEVKVGQLRIRAIETPGHSVGHLAFLMEDAGVIHLFSGDAVFFGGKILLQSTWDCDLQAYITSLRKLSKLPIDVLLPGHLAVSLRDGRRHLASATGMLDRGLIPRSIL